MQVKFTSASKPLFFLTLKNRVEKYFSDNNISQRANSEMIFKTIFLLTVFWGSYALLISDTLNGYLTLTFCAVLGLFKAFIGFNISHDATHGSYSDNYKVNKALSYTFDMLGASSHLWNIAHNQIHHTYTNIPEHDDDLEPVFFVRLNPTKKVYKIHRYQHYYAAFFYCLTTVSWLFIKDYSKMFGNKILNFEYKKLSAKDIAIIFGSKLSYYLLFIIIPLLTSSFAWWQVIIGFFVMQFAAGLTLALVFQLAHVVENTDFPVPDSNGSMEENWAVHQLYTTADFAKNSRLATFFFGGLNYQVEHHLFPRICHIHYKHISEIVKQTALEFEIPYHENKTMWQALKSHFRMLKKFGHPDSYQPAI